MRWKWNTKKLHYRAVAAPLGGTGERFIIYDQTKNKYVVTIPYRNGRKVFGKSEGGYQRSIGNFKTLIEAIECRDKYITEYW